MPILAIRVRHHRAVTEAEAATILLAETDWLDVEQTGDPDLGDLRIRFGDLAWQHFDGLIEQSVEVLSALPGVSDVLRDSADLLLVWIEAADPDELEGHLRAWWSDQLRDVTERP